MWGFADEGNSASKRWCFIFPPEPEALPEALEELLRVRSGGSSDRPSGPRSLLKSMCDFCRPSVPSQSCWCPGWSWGAPAPCQQRNPVPGLDGTSRREQILPRNGLWHPLRGSVTRTLGRLLNKELCRMVGGKTEIRIKHFVQIGWEGSVANEESFHANSYV